ncbi:helix-turn-helix domain-containing protein [Flammeovirga kamogawensis]|uniref:Helix-turn-helix transcriptional regulator n=1 Tax=Flammeovirga kamogawensis TaxID=373891 RepID=A0ABX8GXG3_9BACT|nr:AraC family transcriptional regulator [Flammeovirga kamogawensis]MBB6460939.1 AraC-like DNA-binding protein [Flammeovirga kamogawensis]QWG08281.1 helix-turn-helix transcriptional regulator [Flammeovirga kamogawensis]TRX70083.1 helix-turn-helix transcriptional regulator [Flammeovirga kamogawensis]
MKVENIFSFYEASEKSILTQFHEVFGGQRDGESLKVATKSIKLNLYHYEFMDGLSFYINDFKFKEDNQIITIGNPDTPSLIMRFDYKGNIFDNIEKNTIGINSGMFLYANTKSYVLENKGETNYKWFTIRISKEVIERNFTILLPLFDLLENDNTTWLIGDLIPMEVFLFLKDIFELSDSDTDVYRKRIIISRGIECLAVFAERLIKRDQPKNLNIHKDDLNILLHIKDDVINNLLEIPSIEELSLRYGYSSSKFKRDFKKVFGKPVHKFYIEFKLEKAKQLLLNEKLTITEVSRIIGYKSLAKFSSAFKQQYGVSPKKISI